MNFFPLKMLRLELKKLRRKRAMLEKGLAEDWPVSVFMLALLCVKTLYTVTQL